MGYEIQALQPRHGQQLHVLSSMGTCRLTRYYWEPVSIEQLVLSTSCTSTKQSAAALRQLCTRS